MSLKQGVVISVPDWKVPVISRKKYLKQPEIAVSIKFDAAEVSEMPDKQFKAFEVSFNKTFDSAFQKMSNSWFADMQKTIDTTEEAIEKLAKSSGAALKTQGEKLLQTVVDKTNALLEGKCKQWTQIAQELAQKAYESAFVESIKAMKAKVTKAKAKMIAKVTLFVVLTLTAAALTIALAVVTAGAGAAVAPLVIAGIATAGKAMFGSVKEVLSSYDVLGGTIASIESDAAKLDAAVQKYSKASQKTATTMDKLKLFKAALQADMDGLNKHVGQLDKFVAVARASTAKRLLEIQALADQLAKAAKDSPEAAKIEKKVLEAQRAFDSAMEKLKAIDEIKEVAAKAKDAYTKLDPDGLTKAMGRVGPIVSKLNGAVTEIKKYAPLVKEIITGVQGIVAAAK